MMKILSFLLLVGVASPASAQEVPCEPAPLLDRTLGEHEFIPSRLVRDPFTATFVAFTVAYGYAWTTGPRIDVLGRSFGERDYEIGGIIQSVEAGVRFVDWFSLRLSGTSTVFTGLGGEAALVVGSSALFTGQLGATFGLPVGARSRLALTFDAAWKPQWDVLIAAAIERAIRESAVRSANLLVRSNDLFLVPGLAGAFGFNRTFGAGFDLQYVHTRRDVVNGDVDHFGAFAAGLQLNADLAAATSIPIAFVGAYRVAVPFEGSEETDHEVGLGLFYSGRRELVLGLDASVRWFELRRVLDTTALFVTATIRYYWN